MINYRYHLKEPWFPEAHGVSGGHQTERAHGPRKSYAILFSLFLFFAPALEGTRDGHLGACVRRLGMTGQTCKGRGNLLILPSDLPLTELSGRQ